MFKRFIAAAAVLGCLLFAGCTGEDTDSPSGVSSSGGMNIHEMWEETDEV